MLRRLRSFMSIAAAPRDRGRVDAELVAVEDVRVDERRQQVVRRRDRVQVAGEVEVQVLHRHDLRVAAAGGAALDAEDRAERRLAEAEDRLAADVAEALRERDRGGRLALAGRRRRDRRDVHDLRIGPVAQAGDRRQRRSSPCSGRTARSRPRRARPRARSRRSAASDGPGRSPGSTSQWLLFRRSIGAPPPVDRTRAPRPRATAATDTFARQSVCVLHNAPPTSRALYLPRCEPFLHNVPELRAAAVHRLPLRRRDAAARRSGGVRGGRDQAPVDAPQRRRRPARALVPPRRLPPLADDHARHPHEHHPGPAWRAAPATSQTHA